MSVVIRQASSSDDWRQARRLVEEYAASLDVDLTFQQFDDEIAALRVLYAPPSGAFFLAATATADMLGCVGLRRFSDGIGEMKRLYTRPAARGHGLGRQLAVTAITTARQLGYTRIVLDTLPTMTAAQQLYTSLGFRPTAVYRFNPVEGTRYLALDLTAARD